METTGNVRFVDSVDAYGNAIELSFEGDALIKKTTFDAQPLLEEAKAERNATAGERWGEMRRVGTIPMAVYAKAATIRDNKERRTYIQKWLRDNPAFVTFDRYLVRPA